MNALAVIAPAELASGYRLAGARTLAADSPSDAHARLRGLVDDPGDVAVIAVYEPHLAGLAPADREELERLAAPLVIALPSGGGQDAAASRRDRLLALLRRAVGYEITFESEERS